MMADDYDLWWYLVYADEIEDAIHGDDGNWLDDCEHDRQCTCNDCLRVMGYGYEYSDE